MGFVLVCDPVRSALFVSRALAGYDEIRSHVAEWAPIEPARGLSGYLRGVIASFRQRVRDVRQGALAQRDPSLAAELDLVRGLSNERWKNYTNVRSWTRPLWFVFASVLFVFLIGQLLLLLGR